MKIVKIISEHKVTKRATRYDNKTGARTILYDTYRSKVGFVEAIVSGEHGKLYTAHVKKPRNL